MTVGAVLMALLPLLVEILKQSAPYIVPAIFQSILTPYSASTDVKNNLDQALVSGDTAKLAYFNSVAIKGSNTLSQDTLQRMAKLVNN